MRWLMLGLAAPLVLPLTASGGDEGAVLTVSAPAGPAGARRIDAALARPAEDALRRVDGQRVGPGALVSEPVRYYGQRATAGAVEDVTALDGFAIRIEPDAAVAPDDAFVPFLLAYDAA